MLQSNKEKIFIESYLSNQMESYSLLLRFLIDQSSSLTRTPNHFDFYLNGAIFQFIDEKTLTEIVCLKQYRNDCRHIHHVNDTFHPLIVYNKSSLMTNGGKCRTTLFKSTFQWNLALKKAFQWWLDDATKRPIISTKTNSFCNETKIFAALSIIIQDHFQITDYNCQTSNFNSTI